MLAIHTTLLYFHIALGSIALLLYWLPIVTRKGSALHIKAGKWFYAIMLVLSGSGMLMCSIALYDPIAIYVAGKNMTEAQVDKMLHWRIPVSQFLLLLSLLTWVTVRHAVAVLRVKHNNAALRAWPYQGPNLMLLLLAIYVGWQGITVGITLLIIFAAVSLLSAISICFYVYKKDLQPRQWIIEHFSSMIGAGIAVYTAFFAAGGRRIVAQWLPEHWQLVTWLAAPALGTLAILTLKGYYQRKFNVVPAKSHKALQQN
jgi:hypothetical protein